MRRIAFPACLLALALVAAPARASVVSVRGDSLVYTAATGEDNDLVIRVSRGNLVLLDGPAAPIEVGAGCLEGPDGSAACAADPVRRVELRLGDGDDAAQVPSNVRATVLGGPGSDQLTGGGEGDRLVGGPGADILLGGRGGDTLEGGDGNDQMVGREGDDTLLGGAGGDQLDSGDGADTLDGGDGGDLLIAGPGSDQLMGGAGSDALNPGADADRVEAGDGDDRIDSVDALVDSISCGTGGDEAKVDGIDELQAGCEQVRLPDDSRLAPDVTSFTPMEPYPVVRIVGQAFRTATRVQRLSVRAPSGARVVSRCGGRGCPFRSRAFVVPRSRAFVLRALAGRYRTGVRIELYVTSPDRIGKYTRFVMRRGQAPRRTDLCVAGAALRPVPCGS